MQRIMMKSKIHRAVVTGADVAYRGSITLDPDLIDAADLVPFERVQVVNVNNGARFETYVIEGEPSSGTVCLNGAAARLALPGDPVIIISYASFSPAELTGFAPRIVMVDERNRPQPAFAALNQSSSTG